MSPPARRASAWRARRGAVDDDRAEGVAEHRGDRPLGAGVDLEVVDERADHAGHVAERGGGVAVAGLVERGCESLGPCLPARGVGVGVARRAPSAVRSACAARARPRRVP